jgi:hypothetical protein
VAELARLVAQTESAIRERFAADEFHPGKVSVWIKLIRQVPMEQTQLEETVGSVHKVLLPASSFPELIRALSENLVVTVYGGELQIVREMPNLIIKLFDRKAVVPVPGAPPLDQAGQIFLKATVYRWEPSLWDQLFHREQTE